METETGAYGTRGAYSALVVIMPLCIRRDGNSWRQDPPMWLRFGMWEFSKKRAQLWPEHEREVLERDILPKLREQTGGDTIQLEVRL